MAILDPTAPSALPEPHHNGHGDQAQTALLEPEAPEETAPDAGAERSIEEVAYTGAAEIVLDPTAAADLEPALETAGEATAVARRAVAGSYRSAGAPFQVELRIDIDGASPTRRVSADYYSITGGTVAYFGSMRVDAPAITVTPTTITIRGTGRYTWASGAPRVEITLTRVPVGASTPAPATLRHRTTSGAPGATYACRFRSPHFRTVLFEQDRQDSVASPVTSYATGSLPSGGPARTLTVAGAFAEAGVAMVSSAPMGVVNTGESGANATWSDAELHAAMQRHFSRWRDIPQWAVWLFHAFAHDRGPGLLGIMFDQHGRQRQGCAVFYRSIAGTSPERRRLELFTSVHELGHCFNLLHSWQKGLASPPAPNRPNSPSWMNYPRGFPAGEAAFWSGFGFRFDLLELVHLRHAFRDDVVMGGKPFAVGAALEGDESWRPPEQDASGLSLTVTAPRSLPFGAPVSVDLALRATDERPRRLPSRLGPRPGTVDIAISRPGGSTVLFEPLLHHCIGEEATAVPEAGAPVTDTAFIHYGANGFAFDQPGRYEIRARHTTPEGAQVLSAPVSLLVRAPASEEDNEVADLLFGDEQGALLDLVGSDAPELQAGVDALRDLVERHPDHPLTAYARLALGVNAAREFKQIREDGEVEVRKPDTEEAEAMLAPVIAVDAARKSVKRVKDEAERVDLAAASLEDTGTAAKIPSYVDAYVRARAEEIGAEVV